MAVVMITEVPGADVEMMDAMRQAGVLDDMARFQGFRGHWSGATGSGYCVVELWDSRDDWQAWFDTHVAPNMPPGVDVATPNFFELHAEVTPSA